MNTEQVFSPPEVKTTPPTVFTATQTINANTVTHGRLMALWQLPASEEIAAEVLGMFAVHAPRPDHSYYQAMLALYFRCKGQPMPEKAEDAIIAMRMAIDPIVVSLRFFFQRKILFFFL